LRLAESSCFVLFGVGCDVFQRPLDGLRDGVRCGQVGPLWDKAVLVGRVREADAGTIWRCVLVPTLGDLGLLLGIAQVLHEAFFLSLYLVGRLIAATLISTLLSQIFISMYMFYYFKIM
jgi:hypothetical protein